MQQLLSCSLLPLPPPLPPLPQLFVQAVGEANQLSLAPLVLPKAMMDELLGYGTVKKVPSTDTVVPPRSATPTSIDPTPSPDPPTLKGEPALSKGTNPVSVTTQTCLHLCCEVVISWSLLLDMCWDVKGVQVFQTNFVGPCVFTSTAPRPPGAPNMSHPLNSTLFIQTLFSPLIVSHHFYGHFVSYASVSQPPVAVHNVQMRLLMSPGTGPHSKFLNGCLNVAWNSLLTLSSSTPSMGPV